jgi:BirA family biotin operon repressor/biotin-[acetyl-CoA-carboxylase] ligase
MDKTAEHLIILHETDSSNNYAIQLIRDNRAVHGTVIMALCQNAGKGQRGKEWISEPNMNLLASIIVFPNFMAVSEQFYLSKIASLAVREFLMQETTGVSVKWPNDIYCGDNKICGILIENMVQGDSLFASVIGIGLNLNQVEFNRKLPNPVSLKSITGKSYSIIEVLEAVRQIFFKLYGRLEEGFFKEVDENYLAALYRRSEWSTFREGERIFEARVKNIGCYGQLITEDRNGRISEYMFGEIEFVNT